MRARKVQLGDPMTLSHTAMRPPPMALPPSGEQPRPAPVTPALAHARTGMHRHGMIALPAEERWVHTARHFAASLLARWDVVPEDQDSVLLIVGELAGNAAQHGRADMIVSLALEGRAVRIEVADSGATAPSPHPRCTGAPDEHGRGAGIVELLADWTETLEERDHRRDRAGLRVATAPAEQPQADLALA
ncbi:anti-sigma regulatory factor (Ser/Thr protein kinase) [Streptomyces sp. SLBN-115]|nr:anti-sigma regulatory factor (Ser/Thr protein kinase) [Streptomyces sp. SLBN-115]